jgi:hypothetical protein
MKKKKRKKKKRKKKKTLLISKLNLNVRKNPVNCYICGTSWALRKVYQQYIRSFEK